MSRLIVTEPLVGKIKPAIQEGKQIGQLSNLLKQITITNNYNSNYNKTELVDQIFDWFKIKQAKLLNNLRTTNIYPSKENVCMIMCSSVREVDELTQPTRKQTFG